MELVEKIFDDQDKNMMLNIHKESANCKLTGRVLRRHPRRLCFYDEGEKEETWQSKEVVWRNQLTGKSTFFVLFDFCDDFVGKIHQNKQKTPMVQFY